MPRRLTPAASSLAGLLLLRGPPPPLLLSHPLNPPTRPNLPTPTALPFLPPTGGGTGSGLGSYTLHALEDEFPNVTRITTAVFARPRPSPTQRYIHAPASPPPNPTTVVHMPACPWPQPHPPVLQPHPAVFTRPHAAPSPPILRAERSFTPAFTLAIPSPSPPILTPLLGLVSHLLHTP
jgi:hypothetical protein